MANRNNSQTPAPSRRFVHPSSSATQSSASSKKLVPAFSQRPPVATAVGSSRNVRFGTPVVQRDDISTSFEGELDTPSLPARGMGSRRPGDTHDEIDVNGSQSEADGAEVREVLEVNDLHTPMPKRQKRTHSRSITADPIAISSSPSDNGSNGASSDDGELGMPYADNTPVNTSKFRPPAPMIKLEEPKQKPSFRHLEPAMAVTNDMSTTLPDAFTPSRRKGKRDYIPGGLADTVRSWVLQAATEDTHRGGKAEREVEVAAASLDDSRRAIACTDVHGLEWLLLGSQPWSGSGLNPSIVDRIDEKGKVIVRGTATSWTVPLKALGQANDLQVAAHWEFLS